MTTQAPDAGDRIAHSVDETCARTGLGRDRIYADIRAGKLIARKSGKRTLILDDDLRRYLASLPRALDGLAGGGGEA